jgi:hypothetical protein
MAWLTNTFDFCVRLDDLIIGCLEGGNTPGELQQAMLEAIEKLSNPESDLIPSDKK